MLGLLPAFYVRRTRFALDRDVPHYVRILVAMILRNPADLVGVPSGGCVSATWHHYLGRNNSKGEHRTVRVPPNHPSNQVSCNISKSCCRRFTKSGVEEHNET